MQTIETQDKAWTRCTTCERFRSNLDDEGNCVVCRTGQAQEPIAVQPGGMADVIMIDGVDVTQDVREQQVEVEQPLDQDVLEDLSDMQLIVEKPRRWWHFRRRRD